MSRQQQLFEFHVFGEGGTDSQGRTEFYEKYCPSEAAAKGRAGRKAIKVNGPVDVAYSGEGDWTERYVTTASPSEHHATGYRFERLES